MGQGSLWALASTIELCPSQVKCRVPEVFQMRRSESGTELLKDSGLELLDKLDENEVKRSRENNLISD